MKKILFICIGNSCRSQMAEALCRAFYPEVWEPFSGGIAPEPIRQETLLTLQKYPLMTTEVLYSKPITLYKNTVFDIVITLCDYARDNLTFFPQATQYIHRHIHDPANVTEQKEEMYERTAQEIEIMIHELHNSLTEKR